MFSKSKFYCLKYKNDSQRFENTRFKDFLTSYTDTTSMHGVPHITRAKGRSPLK